MASLSSPGVGSNLDVREIVSQLMTVERQPLVALDKKEASFRAKLTSLGLVKGTLSSLQIAAQKLNLSSTYSSVKASVADATAFSANVTGATPAGSYNVEVKNLAEAQKLISGSYATAETAVGKGTLSISVGSYSSADAPPVGFTAKSGTNAVSITIDASNNTLAGVRDAINASQAGVSATIINDGNGFRLSLTAKETGSQNEVRIAVSESGGAGLAQLAYDRSDGATSNLTQNVAARDAVIKVDGITITKPTNTITDAIQGVTLNLTKEMTADTTTKLTLTRDTAATRAALEGFVKAYNDVHKQISSVTNYDASTGKASVLTGDATMRSVQTQLRSALSGAVSGAPAGMSVLSDAGISFERDGTLSLDTAKLDKVLADPNKDLSKLFTKGDDGRIGLGSRVNTLVSSMIFGGDAVLNGRIDGINTSLKSLDTQRAAQNVRLATVEKRYLAQFTALDVAIASMSKTSAFLTQQLESMRAQLKS